MKLKERPPRQGRQMQIDFDGTRPAAPPSSTAAKSTRRHRPPKDPYWWASFVAPSKAEFEAMIAADGMVGL